MSTPIKEVAVPVSTLTNKGKPAANSADSGAIPRLKDRLTQELVIALVGPVGSGCTTVGNLLQEMLEHDYGYAVGRYKLSELIGDYAHKVGEKDASNLSGSSRIRHLQKTGDALRKAFGPGYLAAKAIEKIAEVRAEVGTEQTADGGEVPVSLRRVHIVDSLKNPKELQLLRDTYGDMFWVFGVFAPEAVRKGRLQHVQGLPVESLQEIIATDYSEAEKHGQSVRDVFHEADFFVRNDQETELTLKESLSRYLEILFGFPVHTPTVDESSMYAAHAEAAKSACLSRQVGAAITDPSGEIIGLGRNDVPRFGGGLYGEENGGGDHRCFKWTGHCCHNDQKKENLYEQIAQKLIDSTLLKDSALRGEVIKALKDTDIRQLIEYSRAVHAEMDAIVSVARSHKAGLVGGTLYATTFPCHSCARHIVASGVKKVLYIEPYPKSLALELHRDAVSEDGKDATNDVATGKVVFLQYSGVAPKNMLRLFNVRLTRKEEGGKLRAFDKRTASPLVAVSLDDFPTHEKYVIAEYAQHERDATTESQAALFES
ncbi:anti-phage dCTP deaminase [Paraburkholderia megapolitana]|uniref:anti-phage dCTP deaminase n=1 Tax=Paraburkholderia megapolitana TaxID=420953 RepID=UPI0038BA9719